LDIGVLGYIGIVQHKEHSPEVLSIPPGTPCILWVRVFTLNFPVCKAQALYYIATCGLSVPNCYTLAHKRHDFRKENKMY